MLHGLFINGNMSCPDLVIPLYFLVFPFLQLVLFLNYNGIKRCVWQINSYAHACALIFSVTLGGLRILALWGQLRWKTDLQMPEWSNTESSLALSWVLYHPNFSLYRNPLNKDDINTKWCNIRKLILLKNITVQWRKLWWLFDIWTQWI